MKKRILSIILALLLIASLLLVSALADCGLSRRETYINPLYRNVISESDIPSPKKQPHKLYSAQDEGYVEGLDAAAAILRDGMEKREAEITVKVVTDDDDPMQTIGELALEETGVPTQGDYLRWTYGGWSGEQEGYIIDDLCYLTITYDILYYTTAEQETELGGKIDEVLSSFGFTEHSTDYEKICAVYDYICANVSYDYDNLYDYSYLLKHTAYAAMMNKTAVCQGYALLLYRMLMQLGISCRLIPSNNHAWNIVRINGLYYNVDSTWDAGSMPEYYRYFLHSDETFYDHPRADEYKTEAFYAQYPMSKTDFALISGDLNGDGALDARDLVRLKKYLAGAAAELSASADLNNDGWVNAIDIVILQKLLAA